MGGFTDKGEATFFCAQGTQDQLDRLFLGDCE